MQRTFRCNPIQVSQWKRQLLDGAGDLFSKGRKDKEKGEQQASEAELFQETGKLKMELEWLKKVSTARPLMNFASWSIWVTHSSLFGVSASCWDDPNPPSTTSL
jgi:transposase-like protein